MTSVQTASTDRAIYRYLGMGHVVDTDMPEPDAFSRRYGSTGTYPDLDAFNRPVSFEWTKDRSTDRDFVDVDLSYDENSNITLINDAVLASAADVNRFDISVTMDALNRMTKVEEGEWGGSSITTRARQQLWQDATDGSLEQMGNWRRHKTDWSGDNDFVDAGEYDDDRGHTAANESEPATLTTTAPPTTPSTPTTPATSPTTPRTMSSSTTASIGSWRSARPPTRRW